LTVLASREARKTLLPTVHTRTCTTSHKVQVLVMVTVKQLVFVDPNVTLAVDLAKRVKVELTNKRLESIMPKVLRQSFGL
jgi:hypothetical protein